jgi:tRNA pseudouridine(38-40) synthase
MNRVIYRSEMLRVTGGGMQNSDEEWVFTVRGKSFLRYMVRKIVGTLVDVGRGKFHPEDVARLFEMRDRSKSGPTMPPQGLCLAEVEYPDMPHLAGGQ